VICELNIFGDFHFTASEKEQKKDAFQRFNRYQNQTFGAGVSNIF